MKTRLQILLLLTMSLVMTACGSGDGFNFLQLSEAPQVQVAGNTKQLMFSWSAFAGASHYRLMENPDGTSGFAQVGDNIPAGTLSVSRDIAVHEYDWINARYIVEACNATGCTGSDIMATSDVMLDAIGYFKASNTGGDDEFGGKVAT